MAQLELTRKEGSLVVEDRLVDLDCALLVPLVVPVSARLPVALFEIVGLRVLR